VFEFQDLVAIRSEKNKDIFSSESSDQSTVMGEQMSTSGSVVNANNLHEDDADENSNHDDTDEQTFQWKSRFYDSYKPQFNSKVGNTYLINQEQYRHAVAILKKYDGKRLVGCTPAERRILKRYTLGSNVADKELH